MPPEDQNARQRHPELCLLTVGEVEELLGFKSRAGIEALEADGKLKRVIGLGRAVRFRYADVQRLIADDEQA